MNNSWLKSQKKNIETGVRLLILVAVVFVGLILLKPSCDPKGSLHPDDGIIYSDFQTIDSLKTMIIQEKEENVKASLKITRLSRQLDSTKELLGAASERLQTLEKRKKDEKTVDYSGFTDDELSRYLSDRYKHSDDLRPATHP